MISLFISRFASWKYLTLLFSIIMIAACGGNDPGGLTLRVVDDESNIPLAGAKILVLVNGEVHSQPSDTNGIGRFEIDFVDDKVDGEISVQTDDYEVDYQRVTLRTNTVQNVRLDPIAHTITSVEDTGLAEEEFLAENPATVEPIVAETMLQIGELVSDKIALIGEIDEHTFTATPGQMIYFDVKDNTTNYRWELQDENLSTIFDESFFDQGPYTLENGGTYTLIVDGREDNTGSYQFRLWDVPPPDESSINIGDTIAEGRPEPGVGKIETPGVIDRYTFTATPGQIIYFDVKDNTTNYRWELQDENLSTIFDESFFDQGPYTLENGGTYTLIVDGREDNTGSYQFRLWDVPPPGEFSIDIGDTIAEGRPEPGAGKIETPGVIDRYTFTATPGQVIYFDVDDGTTNYRWELQDENLSTIFDDFFHDQDPYTLDNGGTYTLIVDGREDNTGSYQFSIVEQ